MQVATAFRHFNRASRAAEALRALLRQPPGRGEGGEASPEACQRGFLPFYAPEARQPWLVTRASGPWLLTSAGVVYDAGGYGMLSLGHNPIPLLHAVGTPHVMANVMTPNAWQSAFRAAMRAELEPEYDAIACLNSGSEANTLAMRIANRHAHARPVRVAMSGSFHGRTELPALMSATCRAVYARHLCDYQTPPPTYFVNFNDCAHAEHVFGEIDARREWPEVTLFEPVQGEGNPGVPIDRDFYATLRRLTAARGGLLLADSVQYGLRCTGSLSVVRDAALRGLPPPDMETFSKALNGGQFPLSVLAVSRDLARAFTPGLYGNTFSANPRALHVGATVLECMTDGVRRNVRLAGAALLRELERLVERHGALCTHATGTGLLLALHLDPRRLAVRDAEAALRARGLNVIHGGANALRFTPWFELGHDEIAFIASTLDAYFASLRPR